jgi:acyl-CoA synthetase (AMP-forming)/AMP-acid ligase II
VRAQTLTSFAERFATSGLDPAALYPCYGLAESTLMVTGAAYGQGPRVLAASRAGLAVGRLAPAESAVDARRVVSCGAPVAETELRIVDPHTRNAREPGEIGEVWVRGPSLASGYWGARGDGFGAELIDHGGGFLRTGDLGALWAGELYVLGRRKDLLIQDGRNLHPSDIEAAAERALAVVPPNGAAAFAIETAQGEEIHLAVEMARTAIRDIDVRNAAAVVRGAVAREAEAALAGVHFLKPGALPKTSSGKVQRARCRELFLAGALAAIG